MSPELLAFYAFAALSVVTALGVVTARHLVHGALWMVAHFLITAVLYLALHAPFIAAVQVIVYAGAIMVLFMFVVMLLGRREAPRGEPLVGQRPLALLGLALLGGLLVAAVRGGLPGAAGVAEVGPDFGSPGQVGLALYQDFVLPFELMSVLLLGAMVGVVVIARLRGPRDASEPGSGAEEAS